jgi:hypothetical protein
MYRYTLPALFFIIFPLLASAANIEIRGTLTDAETGETLPSATILLEGTYRGTITNPDGEFNISVDCLPVTLTFRYIGYNSVSIEITGETEMPIQVSLERAVAEMDEIVVTERDPGLSIMERVIARKQIWRAGLENYRVDAYTRQSISSDTSIASITESSSVAWWHRDKGHREIQLSSRQTSNLTEDQNFAGVRYLPNFYDDNIEIAGYRMMGITHPDALRYYRFSLEEVSYMDGRPVYKINVEPRRTRQPLFEGTAWVLGVDYALLEVDLKPNDVVSFPPPIRDFDLSYKQQFSNYGGEFWLPVDMRIEGRIRIAMVGLRFPAMNFRQVSRLSDYEINTAIPDSVFMERSWFVRADSTAKGEFREIEQIPLTAEESLAYETIDSTKTLEDAFRPEGFLARMIDSDDESSERREGPFAAAGRWLPDGLSPEFRFNRSDGFHTGLKFDRRFSNSGVRLTMHGGYGFYSELWDYGAGLNVPVWTQNGRSAVVFAGYENATRGRYESGIYTRGMNTVASLLGGEDYFDYYRSEQVSGGIRLRNLFPRSALTVTASHEAGKNFEIPEPYDYSLFGWHRTRRPNIPADEGILNSLKAVVEVNRTGQSYGFAGSNGFTLSAEWSDGALGSDFDFLQLKGSADLSIPTFYQRRLFANSLDIHLSAGTAFGDLPLQRYGTVDGSMTRFTPFGTLRTRKFLPYEGSRYWLAAAEHNFRTIPFEVLGLQPLVDRGWGVIFFAAAGQTHAPDSAPAFLPVSDGIHTEAGASLNSVFGILRIDAAFGLDRPGFFLGFSVPRYF